ncbi:MAG: sulfatase-like hydrolase/transferase, partial [FCB group bacterium]|nr:sulfatase-like hydrolase/transferase [FCB group bacterium]
GPIRRSLLTGRMPSVHGAWDNGTPLDWDANTFVRVLRENGYQTGLIGKSHIQEMFEGKPPDAGPDMPSIKNLKGEGDAINPTWEEGWDQWEMGNRHRNEWVDIPEDYYGFDHVELICGHQDLPSGHYLHWVREQGLDDKEVGGPKHALKRFEDWNQVYQSSVPEELYPTSYVTKRSVEFLEQAEENDQPFFLFASYPDPHHPFTSPGHYYDMYDPKNIPLPESFYDPHLDSMPHVQKLIANRGKDHHGPFPCGIDEEQYRHATAVEYGSISMIDEGIGELLNTLKRLGLEEDTIVVFTSDHADMFGDHGLMLKHALHYQGVVHVPLLVKVPGMTSGKSNSLVSLLDLGQTILDLTGCPEYKGMQGHSIRPILEESTAKVRDRVLIEEGMPVDVTGQDTAYCLRTLVTDNARLTIYDGFEHGELFDLKKDPEEFNNLFAKPEGAALKAEMMEKLAYTMMSYTNYGKAPKF